MTQTDSPAIISALDSVVSLDTIFAPAGAKVQIATASAIMVHKLVETGDRLALMTSFEYEQGDGRLVRLRHAPIAPAPTLGVITRSDWLPTALHADCVELLRRQLASIARFDPIRLVG